MKILGGDSTLTIGDLVVGGGANRVLYENAAQILSTEAAFTYDDTTNLLTVDNITTSGQILTGSGSAASPFLAPSADSNTGFWWGGSPTSVRFAVDAASRFIIGNTLFSMGSGITLGWSSAADVTGAAVDTSLIRAGAGIIGVGSTLRSGDGASNGPAYGFTAYTTTGMYAASGPILCFSVNGGVWLAHDAVSLKNRDTAKIGWVSTSNAQTGAVDTTFVRASAGNVGFTNGGATTYWTVGAGGIQPGTDITYAIGGASARATILFVGAGSAAAPSISVANSAGTASTGLYASAANALGFTTNGTGRWQMDSTNGSFIPITDLGPSIGSASFQVNQVFAGSLTVSNGAFAAGGSAGNVSFGHASNPDTGIWFPTTTTIRVTIDAGEILTFSASEVTLQQPLGITDDRGLILTNQTDAAGASSGTLTNAPASSNPTFWWKIKINGTNRAVPCWDA